MGVVMAPVAARRGAILEAEREDADDDEDIAVRPPMVREEERTPVERRLSMVISDYTRSSDGSVLLSVL